MGNTPDYIVTCISKRYASIATIGLASLRTQGNPSIVEATRATHHHSKEEVLRMVVEGAQISTLKRNGSQFVLGQLLHPIAAQRGYLRTDPNDFKADNLGETPDCPGWHV